MLYLVVMTYVLNIINCASYNLFLNDWSHRPVLHINSILIIKVV